MAENKNKQQTDDLNLNFEENVTKSINKENIKNMLVNFIVPLIMLVVSMALIFVVIVPTYPQISKLNQELESKKTKKGVLETKRGVLNRLKDFEDVVLEDTKLFKQALVGEPMVPELLTQVDTVARESGLKVIKLSNSLADATPLESEEDVSPTSYNNVKVTLGVTGSYDQFILLNSVMEESTRLIEVEDFRFSTETGEGLGDYTANYVLNSPYLEIETSAVTDEPITVDISSSDFMAIVDVIKSMKHYDISVQDYILENIKQQEEEQTEETNTETSEEEPVTTKEPTEESGTGKTGGSDNIYIDDQSN